MRTRKPWVRFRRRLFGWNVLFIGEPHGPRRRNEPPGGTNSKGYRSGGPPVKRRLAGGVVLPCTPPGRVVPFPGHGYPTTAASFMVPKAHFSTTVEISVQKGYGTTGRPHPFWDLFVTY
jgi:hypothetical protein